MLNIQKKSTLLALIVLYSLGIRAQNVTQTIRGRVIDADTRQAIAEALILVTDIEPKLHTASDKDGLFKINNVSVGRHNLSVSLLGYETKVIPNILVVAGKETVLEIDMREQYHQLKDFVVKAHGDKTRVANDMAIVSARGFTVEETKRYAGAINDPARMVASYAGVNSDGSGNNDIIVRGNNSRNIQWKLEGIEIPNPNHFASEGLTGGPINALNSQMLANSAFYTGAFNPQYGNALAGIFDMKLRTGNNEQREYSFSLGVLGTDVTLEGPFKKGKQASYLANYRYSTLSLLDQAGIVNYNGIPKYQDGSFKINFPTTKAGTFSLFGLGGRSSISATYYDDVVKDKTVETWEQKSKILVSGLSHHLPINDKMYLHNTISFSNNGSDAIGKKPTSSNDLKEYFNAQFNNNVMRFASTLNIKYDARNQLQTGIIISKYNFNFKSKYFDEASNAYITEQENKGNCQLYQGFISWRWRLSEQWTLVNGFHSQKTSLNKQISLEPRSAIRYDFANGQAFSAGFGVHSKMDALPNYYSVVQNATPNKNLSFAKANHYVLGYENKLNKQLFLKAEIYYQQLYHIGIDTNKSSSYSLLNQDEAYTTHALANKGKGKNMGLELTLERYFHNNYYFLITGSIFDSKYLAGDNIWRNTRFNGNFTSNFLIGKEFVLSNKNGKNRVLGINTRTSYLGGRRLLPIDLAASIASGKAIYVDSKAFEQKNDDVFSINLGIVYRIDRKRCHHEFKLDVQNISNNQANIDYYYNGSKQKIETIKQLSTLPVLSYTINF